MNFTQAIAVRRCTEVAREHLVRYRSDNPHVPAHTAIRKHGGSEIERARRGRSIIREKRRGRFGSVGRAGAHVPPIIVSQHAALTMPVYTIGPSKNRKLERPCDKRSAALRLPRR